ncbi:hypothetical protein [Candidatus Liberibacter africanus]|uniref:hypothetical protein n=1 Tax=Liberibacter africanus TaxID=34020 RepID=UPI000640C7B3|nr:hypothetical protein [Candidatus Liberibacter africanus]
METPLRVLISSCCANQVIRSLSSPNRVVDRQFFKNVKDARALLRSANVTILEIEKMHKVKKRINKV